MRQKGAVTVVFSLVFMVLFSFILSFFELAAYTARASYHASASLLAVENYFAAYLEPLYEQYHIFGREVPEGEDVVLWTEDNIADDVAYMTAKRDGERSLLRRSGASFHVAEVSSLTDNGLEGFYSQAVTAMKYRAAPEILEMLKQFAGMTEQANAHMEIAAAKAATDSAYASVDEKILHLIELVDGVDIAKYEKFLGGKGILFQKDAYVKYFCVNPAGVSAYFDRAEVYEAFLSNYENPCNKLDGLIQQTEVLVSEMENREYQEMLCRSRLAGIRGQLAVRAQKISESEADLDEATSDYISSVAELAKMKLLSGSEEEILALSAEVDALKSKIDEIKAQKEQYEEEEKELKKQQREQEKEEKELEKKKKEQQKSAKSLAKEEEAFVRQSKAVRDICAETYDYVQSVREELARAKAVKAECEAVLNALGMVIGEDAEQEYRKDLKHYLFYEDLDGYDFDRMKQTLLENKSCLWNIAIQITGEDKVALRNAVSGLRRERDSVSKYSFEGLKLNYGEMSLAGDVYDGIESIISNEVANGFLGFLTEESLSEKELDTSYLISGLRHEEEFDIFSLLNMDMGSVFAEMQALLPEAELFQTIASGATDAVLLHSYLATHFSDFLEENERGVLSYETEYLIAGKDTDRENLSSVAMRICAMRTILHFISIYTDSARKAPVEQAALAACGIIGLPALKSIVVLLLLFVWALEEAMIDTAALLQGKSLLLYPGKRGGSLSFQEILLFSKSFILTNANQKAEAKGLAFSYGAYLHMFLFMTSKEEKTYRAANLIQENLRKTYQDSFRVGRCVWKVAYEVDGRPYTYAYE